MKDGNGKSQEFQSSNNQDRSRDKNKPVQVLTPSQKNVPKSNISSEMEMANADLSINKSINDNGGRLNSLSNKIEKHCANENEKKASDL